MDRSSHPVLTMETEEGGTNLSGGFAQSVALARIFLKKDAQILILDEALGQVREQQRRGKTHMSAHVQGAKQMGCALDAPMSCYVRIPICADGFDQEEGDDPPASPRLRETV